MFSQISVFVSHTWSHRDTKAFGTLTLTDKAFRRQGMNSLETITTFLNPQHLTLSDLLEVHLSNKNILDILPLSNKNIPSTNTVAHFDFWFRDLRLRFLCPQHTGGIDPRGQSLYADSLPTEAIMFRCQGSTLLTSCTVDSQFPSSCSEFCYAQWLTICHIKSVPVISEWKFLSTHSSSMETGSFRVLKADSTACLTPRIKPILGIYQSLPDICNPLLPKRPLLWYFSALPLPEMSSACSVSHSWEAWYKPHLASPGLN